MVVSGWQLNRFERVLFGVALLLAVLVIVIRFGAVLVVSYLQHHH